MVRLPVAMAKMIIVLTGIGPPANVELVEMMKSPPKRRAYKFWPVIVPLIFLITRIVIVPPIDVESAEVIKFPRKRR